MPQVALVSAVHGVVCAIAVRLVMVSVLVALANKVPAEICRAGVIGPFGGRIYIYIHMDTP